MKNLVESDRIKAEKLAVELNVLLADFKIFYQNLRGPHWNIKGKEVLSYTISLRNYTKMPKLKLTKSQNEF